MQNTPSSCVERATRGCGLVVAAVVVLAVAVLLTAAGNGLIDNVTADSALGGSGLVAGVVGEALAAVALVVCHKAAARGQDGSAQTAPG